MQILECKCGVPGTEVRKYGGKASGKQAGDVETFRRRIYLHLFFNPMRQAEDKVAFETELMDIKSLLEEGKQLQWFDTVENVKVSSILTNKRCYF